MHWRWRSNCFNIGNNQLIIKSNINTKSLNYQNNFDKMNELVSDIKKKKELLTLVVHSNLENVILVEEKFYQEKE